MKSLVFSILSLLVITPATFAQKERVLKKVLELQMPSGSGHNGAAVAWHPVFKKYYASFAGNSSYPFAVFDAKGKILSADLEAKGDIRGLWYNTMSKQVEANLYGGVEVIKIELDSKGIPTGATEELTDMQDVYDEQAVGAYDPVRKSIVYFSEDGFSLIDPNDDYLESQVVSLTVDMEGKDLNSTSIVVSSGKVSNYGLLEINDKKIYLLDSTGEKIVEILSLPENAAVYDKFNFAYANGIYWLFNIELRKWVGYK